MTGALPPTFGYEPAAPFSALVVDAQGHAHHAARRRLRDALIEMFALIEPDTTFEAVVDGGGYLVFSYREGEMLACHAVWRILEDMARDIDGEPDIMMHIAEGEIRSRVLWPGGG